MKLLANENIAREAIEMLRKARHDVTWVREIAPGISDETVLEMAKREGCVLLTCDKDFGELVYYRGKYGYRDSADKRPF